MNIKHSLSNQSTGTHRNRAKLGTKEVNFYYGNFQALRNISLEIPEHAITAVIGPSGCGKSSFLRLFNRMNDLISRTRVEGRVELDGIPIYDKSIDVVELRKKVGMVFQKPNPFPMSVFENVAFGPRRHGRKHQGELMDIVERSLRQAALWDEVKDKMGQSGLALSGGQQQRLCIARTIAIEPEILLMDEPCSALDPIATAKIEELILQLKKDYTIVIVTHNMQQAARISDRTAYLWLGKLIEFDDTDRIFTNPKEKLTEDYISGRFG